MLKYKEKTSFYLSDRHFKAKVRNWLLRGETPDEDALVLQSHDYLNLAKKDEIINAQIESLEQSGSGVNMSGVFIHGGEHPNIKLEKRFAHFIGKEATVLSQSGYAGNTGLLNALVQRGIAVYADRFVHASLYDGAKYAGAKVTTFRHNQPEHLRELLEQYGTGIIMVNSIYSTHGSVSPLEKYAALADEYGCVLIVDESYSIGVYGHLGKGLVWEMGLTDRVDFVTFSLSKAFAGTGGIVAGSADFCNDLKYESRMAIFSSVIEPDRVARINKVLDIMPTLDHVRKQVLDNAAYLRSQLQKTGYKTGSDSHLVSIYTGDNITTVEFRDALQRQGVFPAVQCSPAAPPGKSLVQFIVTAKLSRNDLDKIVEAAKNARYILQQ